MNSIYISMQQINYTYPLLNLYMYIYVRELLYRETLQIHIKIRLLTYISLS